MAEEEAMNVYIVRPKKDPAAKLVSLATRKTGAKNRNIQIDDVKSVRAGVVAEQELTRWIKAAPPQDVRALSPHEDSTPVTGVRVLGMSASEAARLHQEMPDVEILEDRVFDLVRPIPAAISRKQALSNHDIWHLEAIGLAQARAAGFTGTGAGVTVAVLDTGVDQRHAELNGRLAGAFAFDVQRWRWVPVGPSEDTDGHGTHVAGLICGATTGVAPGATILSGVMIPRGRGTLADFILAMEWAAAEPTVQVVNMSAGIPGYLPEMEEAVRGLLNVGVLPVFASGNECENHTRSPGNYRDVVSVGATSRQGKVSTFSSSGVMVVDHHQYIVPSVVAPGASVYSSVMGGGYENWDGTSMATPVVSGIAALILEKYPEMTVPDLMAALLSTCKDLGEPAHRQGHGLIQVTHAI